MTVWKHKIDRRGNTTSLIRAFFESEGGSGAFGTAGQGRFAGLDVGVYDADGHLHGPDLGDYVEAAAVPGESAKPDRMTIRVVQDGEDVLIGSFYPIETSAGVLDLNVALVAGLPQAATPEQLRALGSALAESTQQRAQVAQAVAAAAETTDEMRTVAAIRSLGREPRAGDPPGTYRWAGPAGLVDIAWSGTAEIGRTSALAAVTQLPLRRTLSDLATADVHLSTDQEVPGALIVPAGRRLQGTGKLTTNGTLSVEDRGTLSGLTLRAKNVDGHAIYTPDNAVTRLSDLDIEQNGTSRSMVVVGTGGKFTGQNITGSGGQYGIQALNPSAVNLWDIRHTGAGDTGILIKADGDARLKGLTLIGGDIDSPGVHGVQIWGGDAAVDRIRRITGALVVGLHVRNALTGAPIWATNTLGGVFAGNTINRAILEGYDLEGTDTFAITGNTAVDIRSGAITLLFGATNTVISGTALALRQDMNTNGALGDQGKVGAWAVYICDDVEYVLVSGITYDCRIRKSDNTIQTLVAKILLERRAQSIGPRRIMFVGCKFRNVIVDIREYCEEITFRDCEFSYDFDFDGAYKPFKAVLTDKLTLDNVTWRLNAPAFARAGPNEAPILLSQDQMGYEEGKPGLREITIRNCRVLGWGDNASIAILTWPRTTTDASRVTALNNQVAHIYLSSTCPTKRVMGNYHPDTLDDVTVEVV